MNCGKSSDASRRTWNCCAGIAATLAVFALAEVLAGTPLTIPNPGPIYLLGVVFTAFAGGIVPGLISAIIAVAGMAVNLSSPGHPLLHYSDFDRTRLIVMGIVAPAMAVLVGILKRRADAYHERVRAALVQEAALKAYRDAAGHAENALAERDAILRTVPFGISLLRERKHVWVNRAYAEISGYGKDELMGRSTRQMHSSQEEYDRLGMEAQTTFSRGEQYRQEQQLIRKDGERRWVRMTGCAVDPSDPTGGSIWMLEDIAEQKRAAAALRESERERIADALRQRDVLVREVHHRIKNHLQGVIGLLREHEADHPELHGVIGSIVGQIFSIAVVYGLYSRLGNGEVILCDLVSEIASASAELARPGLKPEIEIAVPAPVMLKRDHAVPVALILNELVLNACKHGEPPVTALVAREGDAIVVTVRNKCGAAAVRGDLVSEEWFGTGLGIARLLVPHDGATLTFSVSDGEFVARLALRAPAIVK